MHGKVIQFKADIANFKVKDGVVTIQLAADTADIVLDKLNEISSGPLMVNKVVKIIDFLLGTVMAILGSTLLMLVVLLLVKLFMGDVYGL